MFYLGAIESNSSKNKIHGLAVVALKVQRYKSIYQIQQYIVKYMQLTLYTI